MASDSPPDISVVLSTYNRCHLLPRTLDSLLAQETAGTRYEIVVVDNNSSDRTSAVLEGYLARSPVPFRHLFELRQGVSYGRNTGIAAARASVIAFTDDDLIPAADWIAGIKRALDQYSEVDYVGGKVLPWPGQRFPAWLTRKHWNPIVLRDPGAVPFYLNSTNPICIGTANCAMRRECLHEFGGFSPAFPRGQDRELQLRLWRAGRQGMYVPDLVVFADVQPERLKKRYHRQWYNTDGRLSADLRDPEVERASARLFDVPAHLYRQAATDAWNLLWLTVQGKGSDAFLAELHLRYFGAFFRRRRREFRSTGAQGTLANIATFLRALWAR